MHYLWKSYLSPCYIHWWILNTLSPSLMSGLLSSRLEISTWLCPGTSILIMSKMKLNFPLNSVFFSCVFYDAFQIKSKALTVAYKILQHLSPDGFSFCWNTDPLNSLSHFTTSVIIFTHLFLYLLFFQPTVVDTFWLLQIHSSPFSPAVCPGCCRVWVILTVFFALVSDWVWSVKSLEKRSRVGGPTHPLQIHVLNP